MAIRQESVTICLNDVSYTDFLGGKVSEAINEKLAKRNREGWRATDINVQTYRLHYVYVAYDVVVAIIFTRED